MTVSMKVQNFIVKCIVYLRNIPGRVRVFIAEMRYGKESEEVKQVLLDNIEISDAMAATMHLCGILQEYATLMGVRLSQLETGVLVSAWINQDIEDRWWYERMAATLDREDLGEAVYEILVELGDLPQRKIDWINANPETAQKLQELRDRKRDDS